MIEIQYSAHLKFRLKYRHIPADLPKKIYETTQEKYFDNDTSKYLAIKRVKYPSKIREMAVVFEIIQSGVKLTTIHPLKKHQKEHRIQAGRWRKL